MNNLSYVQRVLFSCSSLDQINFEALCENLSWDEQKLIFEETALHPLLQKFPIKRSYLINFMKRLIHEIEKHTSEVHDDIYTFLCDLKSIRVAENDEDLVFKHFMYDDQGNSVTLKESASFISNGTTGLCTWEAAIKLAEWAIDHERDLTGKYLLELGSGTGFAGICIAKTCKPKMLYLSDCHEKVLDLLRQNIILNNLGDNVRVLNLAWGNPLTEVNESPDYLIASDIIYDDALFPELLETVNDVFEKNSNCIFILACTLRNQETLNKFVNLLTDCNKKYKITLETVCENSSFKIISPNPKSIVKIYKIVV